MALYLISSDCKIVTEVSSRIRKSNRQTWKMVERANEKKILEGLDSNNEGYLGVREFEDKGRGVVALRKFKEGEFVVEYRGELIDSQEVKFREMIYASANLSSSYLYFFEYQNQRMCIDATFESGLCGRLVNHSRSNANLKPRLLTIRNSPRLVFFAKKDIEINEELLYDYGDRRKKILARLPWLNE